MYVLNILFTKENKEIIGGQRKLAQRFGRKEKYWKWFVKIAHQSSIHPKLRQEYIKSW